MRINRPALAFYWGLLTVLLWVTAGASQEPAHSGRPLWREFDVRNTGARPITRAAMFDDRGLIYAANESGLLTFDGSRWRTYPTTPGAAPLTALTRLDDGTWLTGGAKVLGKFSPSPVGGLTWQSVRGDKPDSNTLPGNILSLVHGQTEVYVITDRAILTWRDDTLTQVYDGLPTGFAFHMEQPLVAVTDSGAIAIEDSQVREIILPPGWAELEAIDLLQSVEGQSLLVTRRSGIFTLTLSNETISLSPVWETLPSAIDSVSISAATRHGDGSFLLGTDSGALIHLAENGTTIRTLNKGNGFRGDKIRAVLSKDDGNAFAFFDGGMVWLDLTDKKRVWDTVNGLFDPVTATIVDSPAVYAGTSGGLYRSLLGGRIRRIEDAGVQPIISLHRFIRSSMRGHTSLLLGRTDGVFDFFDNTLIEITPETPTSVYISHTQPSRIAVAVQNLVRLFEFDRGDWRDIGILGTPHKAGVSDFSETGDGDLLVALEDGSVVRYAADDWLGDDNLSAVAPLDTQEFPRKTVSGQRAKFAEDGDNIHLFASGPALLWDYRTATFSLDTSLAAEISRLFGIDHLRWFGAARGQDTLWLQTNQGSFTISEKPDSLERLPDLTIGTETLNGIFIDEPRERALIATPAGIISLPSQQPHTQEDSQLPALHLRGVTIDGKTTYDGEGNIGPIEILHGQNELALKLSVLDWGIKCGIDDHTLDLHGVEVQPVSLLVNSRCEVQTDVARLEGKNQNLTMQLMRGDVPVTETHPLTVYFAQPWYSTAIPFFVLAIFTAPAVILGGVKSRRVWPEPLRRYLTLVAALSLSIGVLLSFSFVTPPSSALALGYWILAAALTALFLPIFTEAVMRMSDRRPATGR